LNCTTCHTPLRAESPDGRCGLCRLEALHRTVSALGETPPVSTLAVWSLLEWGLPSRVVVLGLRAVRAGAPVDDVVGEFGRLLTAGSAV
jgi:hypothetical protein